MNTIDNFAERVYRNLYVPKDKEKVFVDPATMMMIISLVSGLIKALQECKKNREQAVQVAHNPSFLQKRVVKKHIKKKLGKERYKTEGKKYYVAILAEGKNVTGLEISNAYKECATCEYKK